LETCVITLLLRSLRKLASRRAALACIGLVAAASSACGDRAGAEHERDRGEIRRISAA
jgi:hypothetical protein